VTFVGPWTLFQFLDPIHSRWDSLDRGSARRKAANYTQNNTDIHASSGIRTHDPGIRAGKKSSCLRPRGHWSSEAILPSSAMYTFPLRATSLIRTLIVTFSFCKQNTFRNAEEIVLWNTSRSKIRHDGTSIKWLLFWSLSVVIFLFRRLDSASVLK
jgi:hypothetical protein